MDFPSIRCPKCKKTLCYCDCPQKCSKCGQPTYYCKCYATYKQKEDEFDASFQCYACPDFIIFSSEDPNRIPRTVEQVNGCFREIRGFYWDLMDNAKIPMNFVNSEKKHDVKAPLTTEDKEYLTHLLHVNETIHQLLAPHFICKDIPGNAYNEYMLQYAAFNKYIETVKSTENLQRIYLGNYWDAMMALFEAVEKCFSDYCKRKADK